MHNSSHLLLLMLLAVMANGLDARRGIAEQPKNNQELAQHAWLGMKANVDKLRSGVVSVRGQRTSKGPGSSGPVAVKVSIWNAFDLDQKVSRFDREEEITPEPVKGPDGQLVPQQPKKFGGKFARTPDGSANWNLGGYSATSFPPDAPANPSIGPFDVRAVGLYDRQGLVRGYSFEEYYKLFSGLPASAVEKAEEVYKLCLTHQGRGEEVQTTVWIDATCGWSPVRAERRFRKPGGDKNAWSTPDYVSEVSWLQHGEVWLPSAWKLVRYDSQHVERDRYELVFDWESVNQQLRHDIFTKEGLNLPKGTYLIDKKTDRPVVAGLVGYAEAPGAVFTAPERRRKVPWVIIFVGPFLVLGSVYWFTARARQRGGRAG